MATGNATGAGSAVGSAVEPAVVEAAIIPRVLLYRQVTDEATRASAIVDANELIMMIASVRGAPAGSRCHFELEYADNRVTLSVTGNKFYIQHAMALSRHRGWKRSISVVETVQIRPIARRAEEPEPVTTAADPRQNMYRALRNTRRASGFPKQGRLSQLAVTPQWRNLPLGDVARAFSEAMVPRRAGRAARTPENALREGRYVAWEERGTRRNVRRSMGRARLSSSNSSSNTE